MADRAVTRRTTGRRALRRRAAVIVVASVAAAGCAAAPPGDSTPDRVATESGQPGVRLLVVPHPDDELGAISALFAPPPPATARPGMVSVLLTLGEATTRCGDESGTRACSSRREQAWHQVLDAVDAESGLTTGTTAAVESMLQVGGRAVRVSDRLGDHGMRLTYDLGDGELSVGDAVAALCDAARRVTGRGLRIDQIVVAAYDGGDGERSVVYGHRDHRATNDAVRAQTCIQAPRLERVPRSDDPDVMLAVDTARYERLLGHDGAAHGAYGWLAFSFAQGGRLERWDAADHDDVTAFSRHQGFRCWDRTGSESGARHCP
jgi:LmbE family N-acetylglucosaminyl deacetylase